MHTIERRTMQPPEIERLKRFAFPGRVAALLYDRLVSPTSVAITTKDFRADLEEGAVELINATTEALAIGEEWNDEGPIYFVDLGRDSILFLCGQWLWDSSVVTPHSIDALGDESDRWPKQFILERAPRSGLVFRLNASSKETVPFAKIVAHDQVRYFGDSRIIPGRLQTIEADIQTAFSTLRRGENHSTKR